MAGTDLDAVIRKLAKQQNKPLSAAVKSTRDRYNALATKAKDAETRQRYQQIAKQLVEEGQAAIRRLQLSADNIADSYARAMRRVTETALSTPKPARKKETKPAKAGDTVPTYTKANKTRTSKAKAKKPATRKAKA